MNVTFLSVGWEQLWFRLQAASLLPSVVQSWSRGLAIMNYRIPGDSLASYLDNLMM